jgi:hypothetical protein
MMNTAMDPDRCSSGTNTRLSYKEFALKYTMRAMV